MKNFTITTLVALLFVTTAFASDPTVAVVSAKATNLQEVISGIVYPPSLRETGVEGKVIVVLKINNEGKTIETKYTSYTSIQLKEAVEVALEDLEFTPARNSDGEAIATSIRIPINFELTID